ncbi:hypothetical protein QJS10_CPA09g01950 [Acorus calamus]|uniref:Uncharacterized protein n=1 Tax=Acorus calamus TaxID=4465 RepID=A0AAV9E674_ACOCL|nr:hypothetical protein QJS10_CPA09g01950 [Acorus calamus]
MLLRSSSSPIIGSLISSSSPFLDSPNTTTNTTTEKSLPFDHHHPNMLFLSCNLSDSESGFAPKGLRKARSDGNLKSLDAADASAAAEPPPLRISRRPNRVLETIPSFSVYNSKNEEEEGFDEEGDDGLWRAPTLGDFSVVEKMMGGSGGGDRESVESVSPLFLARGLGIDNSDIGSGMLGLGGGGGGDSKMVGFGGVGGGDSGEGSDVEMYYKRKVEENPCNALFLRNYAQFLYKDKGDFKRAEEYYERAILADPGDGEVLSQYAKLIWELHRDHERTSNYFERAVQAAPQDSHVLADYAKFLWEAEDDDDEGGQNERIDGELDFIDGSVSHGTLASATV